MNFQSDMLPHKTGNFGGFDPKCCIFIEDSDSSFLKKDFVTLSDEKAFTTEVSPNNLNMGEQSPLHAIHEELDLSNRITSEFYCMDESS